MIDILKSRTIWFSIILAVLSVVQGYMNLLPLTPVGQMTAGIVIAVAIAILRFITTTPLIKE